MKLRNILYICSLSIVFLLSSEQLFASESCSIASGPIKELSAYNAKINWELNAIVSEASKNHPTCWANISQQASRVFDTAYADISAMQYTLTDFEFNTKLTAKGNVRSPILRDIKIFASIEKRIETTAETLANHCGFDDSNRAKLHDMIVEVNALKNTYQQTVLWTPNNSNPWIRSENASVAEAIKSGYNPAATQVCDATDPAVTNFKAKLQNLLNIGGKMDDALSTWRRGLALIRGGGYGMSVSEYTNIQRRLLQSELSRQGMTSNMQKTILNNFDCYKSKTAGGTDIVWALEARMECLSNPILWIDRLMSGWRKYIAEANNTDDYTKRLSASQTTQANAINIVEMYNTLLPLVNTDEENNDNTISGLVTLHINLQKTNALLEWRLPAMQNNCMKWQPDIIGGCR